MVFTMLSSQENTTVEAYYSGLSKFLQDIEICFSKS
jgi:hypothetical protein